MADKTIQFSYLAGRTGLTVNVYPRGNPVPSAVINPSPLAATEVGTGAGTYNVTLTQSASGNGFEVKIYSNGTLIMNGAVDLVEASGTYIVQDHPTAGEIADVVGGTTQPGPVPVTITVTDTGATPLVGVRVRVFQNGILLTSDVTDASGVADGMSLSNGTYQVTMDVAGYGSSTQTLVVTGSVDPDVTYTLSQVTVNPSPAGSLTGYLFSYDETMTVESGVTYRLQLVSPPEDSTGYGLDRAVQETVSNGSGYVEFQGLVEGFDYRIQREDGRWVTFTCAEIGTSGSCSIQSCMNSVIT